MADNYIENSFNDYLCQSRISRWRIYHDQISYISKNFAGAHGTSIKSLDVPHIVRNGTGPINLICIYEIDKDDNGLVIKWFHGENQIYQWIPPSNLYF